MLEVERTIRVYSPTRSDFLYKSIEISRHSSDPYNVHGPGLHKHSLTSSLPRDTMHPAINHRFPIDINNNKPIKNPTTYKWTFMLPY